MTNSRKKFLRDVLQNATMVLFLLCVFPGAGMVLAEGSTSSGSASDLGSLVSKFMSSQLTYIPNLLAAFCYIMGIAMMTKGVLLLREHAEDPTKGRLSAGVGRMFAGSALVTLPSFVGWVVATLLLPTTGSVSFLNFNSGMKSWSPS